MAWRRQRAPVGLYFRDADPREMTSATLSLPIDDVSNFTRTPAVWLWIFRHYRADQTLSPGEIGLVRDDARASKITEQAYPLGLPAKTYEVDQENATIDLGAPQWPAGGADFLRLRLKVKYNPLWKLRKPEAVQLEITRADGSRSLRTFVIEPGVATDVWFYPWDEVGPDALLRRRREPLAQRLSPGDYRVAVDDHAAGLVLAEDVVGECGVGDAVKFQLAHP